VTIGGKPLKDHLEALDNYDAICYVREPARQTARLTEGDVRNLPRLVMQRSRPDIAGRYAFNGRTARLLMNLILIRGGYPPVAWRQMDRLDYVRSLQQWDEHS